MSLNLLGWHDTNRSTSTPDQRARSAFARYVFDTAATSLTIEGVSSQTVDPTHGAELGIYVDGAWLQRVALTTNGQRTTASVSLSAGTKRVEVHEGEQAQSPFYSEPTLRGAWLAGLSANAAITPVAYTPPSRRIVIYGDSISVGFFTSTPVQVAWPQQLRADGYHVTMWGHGSRALYDDVPDAAGAATMALFLSKMLDGTSTNELVLQLGYNDFFGTSGEGFWAAASYGTAVGLLLDAVHTVRPDVLVHLLLSFPVSNEARTNTSYGETLSAYRAAKLAQATGRSYCSVWNSTSLSLTWSDGVHPSTASQATIAAWAASLLG